MTRLILFVYLIASIACALYVMGCTQTDHRTHVMRGKTYESPAGYTCTIPDVTIICVPPTPKP